MRARWQLNDNESTTQFPYCLWRDIYVDESMIFLFMYHVSAFNSISLSRSITSVLVFCYCTENTSLAYIICSLNVFLSFFHFFSFVFIFNIHHFNRFHRIWILFILIPLLQMYCGAQFLRYAAEIVWFLFRHLSTIIILFTSRNVHFTRFIFRSSSFQNLLKLNISNVLWAVCVCVHVLLYWGEWERGEKLVICGVFKNQTNTSINHAEFNELFK